MLTENIGQTGSVGKKDQKNLKVFFSFSTNKRSPLGIISNFSKDSVSLSEIRQEIVKELDIPDQVLQSNSNSTWKNVEFFFQKDNFPLSSKQEYEEIINIKDQSSSEIEIVFKTSSIIKKAETHFFPMPPMPPMPPGLKRVRPPSSNLQNEDFDFEENGTKKKKVEEPTRFQVISEPILNNQGESVGVSKYLIFNNDPHSDSNFERETAELCQTLRKVTNNQTFYEQNSKIKQDLLLLHLPKIVAASNQSPRNKSLFESLISHLQKEYSTQLKAIESMTNEGKISFSTLWHLFQKESKFQARMDEDLVGSIVTDSKYCTCFLGDSFSITGSLVTSNGNHFTFIEKTFQIGEFEGLKDIKDLPIQPLSQKNYEFLTERGKIFRDYALGAHYLQYTGSIRQTNMWYTNKFKADGRVMIDPQSFQRFNPNSQRTLPRHMDDSSKTAEYLVDDKLFMTIPTLQGFSFYAKKWGDIRVANLKPVMFDDLAFSRLVLNDETKRLVKSLVTNAGSSFTDIISGKGGGVIFLLHGSPGVGKTLTAEAVSELLHRPLYSVNIGELGVTPDQLENKLSQILEMSSTWNATVLLDEADIFLEQRTNSDIDRNALVGIFLRLLEYHQGVLFLTTNRVQTFDDAFHSRISIALHYQPLDKPARLQIWKNLLEAAKVDQSNLNLEELSEFDLNGRQIKNTIRLSQTLAKEEGRNVSIADVNKCIVATKQFSSHLKTETK